jgi:hypothetical protein
LADQRHDYEAETQELVSKYMGIRSAGEVAGPEDELIRRAKARVDEMKKAYRASRIEVTSQALGISFAPPAFVSLLASALGVGLLAPASPAAAVGVAATKMYYEHRSARTQGDPGWSYVLELQRALRWRARAGYAGSAATREPWPARTRRRAASSQPTLRDLPCLGVGAASVPRRSSLALASAWFAVVCIGALETAAADDERLRRSRVLSLSRSLAVWAVTSGATGWFSGWRRADPRVLRRQPG